MKKIQNKKIPPQKKRQKMILYGLGAGAVLGGGFLAYSYIKNRAATNRGDIVANNLPPISEVKQVVEQNMASFPLKSGARGSLVKMLQSALLALGGEPARYIKTTSIKPGGEPDGIFRQGTTKALLSAGLSTTVSESAFTALIAKTKAMPVAINKSFNPEVVAKGIIAGAEKQNIFTVLNQLALIPDVAGYQAVSRYFNGVRIIGTRVTTLVNALLSVAFASNEAAKVKIRAEFDRMGLVNRNGRWSLSGVGQLGDYNQQLFRLAVSKKPTLLKESSGRLAPPVIKSRKILGYVTGGKAGVIQLYTPQGQIVYAPERNLSFI